jgi:hypothetical protein
MSQSKKTLWHVALLFLLSVVLVTPRPSGASPIPAQDGRLRDGSDEVIPHGLHKLKNGTAWIFLGLQKKDGAWGSSPNFQLMVGKPPQPTVAQKAPHLGDRIRLTGITRLVILDFAITEEKRRDDRPSSESRITRDDSTHILLPIGSEVIVEKLDFGPLGPGGMKAVWARVVPTR